VARRVLRDIMARGLAAGDMISHESAMLERYRVSRESLREGLRLLETQGLVELRRGRGGGARVGAVGAASLGRLSTMYFQLEGGTYEHLLEAWIFAEAALAEAAACNPDLKTRRAGMDPFTRSSFEADDGCRETLPADLAFHDAVAALADNPVKRLLLSSVRAIVATHLIDGRGVTAAPHDALQQHRGIARAIRAGHAARAKQLAEDHARGLAEACRTGAESRVDLPIDWL
jgi:GntR family transcriptional regulator, transcriptional repressor for pyruvate dehydrogenase complex